MSILSERCPTTNQKGKNLSRFKKLSPTIWPWAYHIEWVPKYRYRMMQGKVKEEVELCVRKQSRQMNCEVQEMNVRVPPKLANSEYMGRLKGKSAIRVLGTFRELRQRRYWGNHFGAQGYCVGTVGMDQEMIRKYVKWQERQEQWQEEFRFSR